MDRLAGMRAFVAVAEAESFADAARRLSQSPPAITRAVVALEEHLGARLLHRTTRVVRPTEAGTRFLADAKRILMELEEAERSAAGLHGEPRGSLNLTASALFGRRHVAPILLDFMPLYPGIMLRTLLVDRVVDMVDEGFDIAVRIANLPDSTLTALRVGQVRRVICAAPSYLARHGMPRKAADLAHHKALLFSDGALPRPWKLRHEDVSPQAQLAINSVEVAIAGAVAGQGITRVLSYMIAPELRAGSLQIILEESEPAPLAVQLVHREGRNANAKLRAFIDFAAPRLQAELAALPG